MRLRGSVCVNHTQNSSYVCSHHAAYEISNSYRPTAHLGWACSDFVLRLDQLGWSLTSFSMLEEWRYLPHTACCWSLSSNYELSVYCRSWRQWKNEKRHSLTDQVQRVVSHGEGVVWLVPLRLFVSINVCKHTVHCCPWLKTHGIVTLSGFSGED